MTTFDEFFKKAAGVYPYPYQRKLAEAPELPEILEVPTGAGKTAAAVLSWLWRRQIWPAETPRRLVYCLPMRVLVEQTRACAVRWLNNVGLLAGEATFEGDRLQGYQVDWGHDDKVAVVTLMGGESQGDWHEHPERQAIIVGTQDMLLSRALNRGFAMPPQMWPVDFGFLNVDALWVMDEVQLMGPGRTTSVQLQQFWDERPPAHGTRHTLWMSATLGTNADSAELPPWMKSPERRGTLSSPPLQHTNDDLMHPEFRQRWIAPKRLELRLDPAPSRAAAAKPARTDRQRARKSAGAGAEVGWTIQSAELIDRIRREASGGRLVLAFVNQVKRARELHARLCNSGDAGLDIRLVHARMRPHDRRAIEKTLEDRTPSAGRIVVTTQVLEAGVDIDADALFTEVCPWPSLVQRLGRLNRGGTRPSAGDVQQGKRQPAPAVVFEPPAPARKEKEAESDYQERRSLPYDAQLLKETRELLRTVEARHEGSLSPETLSTLPVSLPLEGPVLRRFDLDDLFDTDPDLTGGHTDVTPWLRAADRDVDVYLLWRRIKGGLDVEDQVPLHRDEMCPAPFYEAQEALAEHEVWILMLVTGRKGRAAWRRARGRDVKAGDTVMVDVGVGCYREHTGWMPGAQESPSIVIDRWERQDGTRVRAWVRRDAGAPSLVEEIDDHVVGPRARDEDPRSFGKSWMELEPHLVAAEGAANALAVTLDLPESLKLSVTRAARWHDVGKALEREVNGEIRRPFQNTLLGAGVAESGHPRAGALYAKSNRRGGPPSGFRHEMASLLAFLHSNHEADDLAAFLILAHHGKVRVLPEAWDDEDPSDLCGVRDGDRIPAAALPHGAKSIALDSKEVLPSREHRSWQGRVRRLLDQHGPFLIAYLEGLVRVADWRAS